MSDTKLHSVKRIEYKNVAIRKILANTVVVKINISYKRSDIVPKTSVVQVIWHLNTSQRYVLDLVCLDERVKRTIWCNNLLYLDFSFRPEVTKGTDDEVVSCLCHCTSCNGTKMSSSAYGPYYMQGQ